MLVSIAIDGAPKEIAALALELQERQGIEVEPLVSDIIRKLQA